MKTRSDSLEAQLTPEQREQLLFKLVEEAISLDDAVGICGDWGISASPMRISRFLRRCGLPWRLERAREAAEASANQLPEDFAEQKRRGLAQREFELAFSDLSAKEVVALKRVELAEARLALDARKIALLEKKIAAAKEVIDEPKLSPAEREQKLRAVFGMT